MKKSLLLLFSFLLLLGPLPLFGEGEDDSEPYGELDFPGWMEDLRRGEIIFFGSLPFTILITTLTYQATDYLIASNSEDGDSAVWGDLTTDDRMNILYITLGLSLSIAVADFILGKIFDETSEKSIP